MPVITDDAGVDFPVLFPLCEVRVVHENWVSFCLNERSGDDKRSVICAWHREMRRKRIGRWKGREVTVA